jgi:hypothetical protein
MKTYNNLYSIICDRDNLRTAFANASRGKSHYKEVQAFKTDMDGHIDRLEYLLRSKVFKNAPYIQFTTNEYHKERHIAKLPFYPDRIIQHAVMQALLPIYDKHLIRDTFACVKGRGIHDGFKRLRKALKSDAAGTTYCLQVDIKKFYPSIDNQVMKNLLRKRISCKDTLWILDEIIDSARGLPIGNYTSQHLANIYLSDFDHWCKEVLRCKYYYRYCDDIVILDSDKDRLHDIRKQITTYLGDRLKLQVKGNWQVFPVASRGIDFLGYRFFHTHTLLRKRIKMSIRKRMVQIQGHASPHNSKAVRSSISSYKGWLKYGNCQNLKRSLGL